MEKELATISLKQAFKPILILSLENKSEIALETSFFLQFILISTKSKKCSTNIVNHINTPAATREREVKY